MSGRKKPDRVVSQLSLWDRLESLQDTPGLGGTQALSAAGDPGDIPSRLSALDEQLRDAAEQCPSGKGLPRRTLSLFDNTRTQREYADRIMKLLEQVCASGAGPHQVFGDFVEIVEASLDMLPAHLASAARSGKLAEDTPEVVQLFERLRARYQPDHFELFAQAFALLLESTEHGYMDVLGDVFMYFTQPNPRLGQYMTPWNVCVFAASLVIPQNGEREVHERLKKAIHQSPLGQAALLTSLLFTEDQQDEAFRWFITRVVPPALGSYEPIRVCDPCAGSGRMLLAAAALYPDWMVRLGLVVFAGAEIDGVLVKVARTNLALYGLNGTGLRYALALAPDEEELLRDGYRLTDDPGRARASVVRVEETPTPEQLMEQLSLFEGDAGDVRAERVRPSPLDGRRCAGCHALPQNKPGTWYVIDEVAYCQSCTPSSQPEEPAGELVEVRYG
jgi:hypothetical protein